MQAYHFSSTYINRYVEKFCRWKFYLQLIFTINIQFKQINPSLANQEIYIYVHYA